MQHPVDRLAAIRRQQEQLDLEVARIRNDIMTGRCGTTGDEYTVSVRKQLLLRRVAGITTIQIVRESSSDEAV